MVLTCTDDYELTEEAFLMNKGVWKGSCIPANNRILILGESHYGDSNGDDRKYEEVDYDTSDVLREYFEHKRTSGGKRWDRFFDRIAASLGYTDDSIEFYEKVFFGNYIDKLCGVGDRTAEIVIRSDNPRLNTNLFNYINENDIDIILCFGIRVYDNLPARNEQFEEKEERLNIGMVGSRHQQIRKYLYKAGVDHNNCNVALKKDLAVFGIPHPSAKGGYDAGKVYDVLKNEEILESLKL